MYLYLEPYVEMIMLSNPQLEKASSSILLMSAGMTTLERLQQAEQVKYRFVFSIIYAAAYIRNIIMFNLT